MNDEFEFDDHGDLVLSEAQILRIAKRIHLRYLTDIAERQRLRGGGRDNAEEYGPELRTDRKSVV